MDTRPRELVSLDTEDSSWQYGGTFLVFLSVLYTTSSWPTAAIALGLSLKAASLLRSTKTKSPSSTVRMEDEGRDISVIRYLISEFTSSKMKQKQISDGLDYISPQRAIMALKRWFLRQITVPANFEEILKNTNKGKAAEGEGLKVICVGLSRTGTSSLKAALSILLPGRTYHAMEFLNEINTEESHKFWTAMRDGSATKDQIRKYFRSRNMTALCDVPCILHWEKIHEAFPEAKIVLTQRDPASWHKSVTTTLTPLAAMVDTWSWMLSAVCFVLYQRTTPIELLKLLLDPFLPSGGGSHMVELETATKFYHAWNEEVEQKCNNNVLVFSVAQGWGPLCDYLNLPVPSQKFPRLNDSSALVRHRKFLGCLICLGLVAAVTVVLLLVFWLFR